MFVCLFTLLSGATIHILSPTVFNESDVCFIFDLVMLCSINNYMGTGLPIFYQPFPLH